MKEKLSAGLERIILIRHADSMEREVFAKSGQSDLERPLSKKGKAQSEQIANFVAKILHTKASPISCLLSSPATRTMETIKPLTKSLKKIPRVLCDSIAPDCGVEGYVSAIKANSANANVSTLLFVGHEPDLGDFVKYAIDSKDDGSFCFQKGVIVELKRNKNVSKIEGGFSLSLLITPNHLGGDKIKEDKPKKQKQAKNTDNVATF